LFFVISIYIILKRYIIMSHNNVYLNRPTHTNLNYYRHFYRKTLFFIIKDKKCFCCWKGTFTRKIARNNEISGRRLKEEYFSLQPNDTEKYRESSTF